MAKRTRTNQLHNRNIIVGSSGQRRVRLDFMKEEFEEANGGEIIQNTAEHVECGDGTVINITMLMQKGNDRTILKLCDACESENRKFGLPANPYSPADHIRGCEKCNKNLCTRHQKLFEGKILCQACKRKLFWLHLFFFRKVER